MLQHELTILVDDLCLAIMQVRGYGAARSRNDIGVN